MTTQQITQQTLRELLAKAETPTRTEYDDDLRFWGEPKLKEEFIVAVDPCMGTIDLDPAAIQVIGKNSGIQAAEYRGFVAPPELMKIAIDLCNRYNHALLVIEVNQAPGMMATKIAEVYGYKNLYYQRRYPGWMTTVRVMEPASQILRSLIEERGSELFKSARLIEELMMYYNAALHEASVAYDDCVMAMLIAQAVRAGVS
jgi:hypothetical protein